MSAELIDTVGLIRNYWPDLQFQVDDVKTCKPEFLERFFVAFFAELNEKISYLINEENMPDELDEIQNFDKKVVLYCKISKLFKKLGEMSPYLIDLYVQNSKMYYFVKCSIHFLILLNNQLDEIYNVVNRNYKKVVDLENLKLLKEQHLQTNAENAENLARLEDLFKILKMESENVIELHAKMLEDKIAAEKVYAESVAEKNSLENEINNLEYELKLLEDQEQNLKDHVITEREFECLRNTETCLEAEYQRLCDDNVDASADLDKEIEYEKSLEQCAKDLEEVQLECLNVEHLQEVRREAKRFEDIKRKFNEELNSLTNDLPNRQKKNEKLLKTFEKMKLEYHEFIKKCIQDVQNAEKRYEKEHERYVAEFEESQRLETEILDIRSKIQKIEEDEHKLCTAVAEEYQAILNADKEATNKFHAMLLNIEKSSIE